MQLEDIKTVVLVFIVAGVCITVGSEILYSMQQAGTGYTATNESHSTWANNTYVALTNTPITGVVYIANVSTTFTGGNVSYNTTHAKWIGGTGKSTGTYVIKYTYLGGGSYDNPDYALSGVGRIASWLPVIGIIIASTIIIGVLMNSYIKRGEA